MTETVRILHAELSMVFPEAQLTRETFGRLVAGSLQISAAQVRNLLQTGEELGLWRRRQSGPGGPWTVHLTIHQTSPTQPLAPSTGQELEGSTTAANITA